MLYILKCIASTEANIVINMMSSLNPKQIASHRNISANAVRGHIKHIYDKLNISSSLELMKILLADSY